MLLSWTESELASCVKRARSSYDTLQPTLLLVLSPFPKPMLFTRVWCLFELMSGTERMNTTARFS